jgi:WD40 repeat protein
MQITTYCVPHVLTERGLLIQFFLLGFRYNFNEIQEAKFMSETATFSNKGGMNFLAASIHKELGIAGFDIWRDQTRLERDWSREIAHALADSDALCLIWSKNAEQSKWVKHEWLTARALEKMIIPCMLPGAPDLPEPLHNVHGIPFDGMDEGCHKLVNRLEVVASLTTKYDYTTLPENSYIPFNPNPNFTGRKPDLLDLYLKMIGNLNKIGVNQVGTVGMGGIGKTQLAVEFTYRFAFGFDGVYWIEAQNPEQWRDHFISLARDILKLEIPNPDTQNFIGKQYVFALQKYCKERPNTLIIMDNVTEPDFLNNDAYLFGLTPLTLGCDLLFTTRKHFRLPGVASKPVDILSPEDAYTLLKSYRNPQTSEEKSYARSICNQIGYLPLAIILVGGYLKDYESEVSFEDYHEELLNNKLDVIDTSEMTAENLATRHEAAVTKTLEDQWKMLKDENAKYLFRLAGQFREAEIIPKARLGLLSGIAPGKSKLDQPLVRAFNRLRGLNLMEELETDASAVRLHPLLRDFALRLIPVEQRSAFKSKAADNLMAAYFDFSRLQSELDKRSINQLLDDLSVGLEWYKKSTRQMEDLKLLQGALRLSSNQLAHDQNQLTGHLLGRSMSQKSARIEALLKQAVNEKTGPWLRPLFPSLTPPGGSLLRTLQGHKKSVSTAAISHDGKYAVSGSWDHTLKVWDLSSGDVIHTLEGHDGGVLAVAISPDGNTAVSGSNDKTLKVWDLSSGHVIHTLVGHSDMVEAVAISPDGNTAVSGSYDHTLKLWDLSTGQVIHTLKAHSYWVRAVAVSPDGKRAVSGSNDNTLKVWDLSSGHVIHTLEGHDHWVMAVAISPDGKRAVSGSSDRTLKVWNLSTGQVVRTLEGHSRDVMAVAISPDGKLAVSGSADHTLKLWDLSTAQVVRTLEGHSGPIDAVAISPDGKRVVSSSGDGLKLWDLDTDDVIDSLIGHKSWVDTVAISSDGKSAVSGSSDRTLKVWNLSTGQVVRTMEGHSGPINAVAISPDGNIALSGSDDHTLKLWDLGTGDVIRTLKGHKSWVKAVAISPDGKRAVSGCWDHTLNVWDLSSGHIIQTLEGHGNVVKAVAISPDGESAVSGSGDRTLKVWDLGTGDVIRTLKGHIDSVVAVAIGPDGKMAVSGSWDHTVNVWDLSTGQVILTLRGHSDLVLAVAISPDGKLAASSSDDHTLKVWDLRTGQEIACFIGNSVINSCAIAPQGSIIIGGERSGQIHILHLEGV